MSGASAVFELSAAVDRTPAGSDDRLHALEALAAHPCAWHTLAATEVWTEISEIHRQRGDWDDAIDAWEHAIRLGYRSAPHPRAEIAELNILAGRRDIGDRLHRELRDRCPDDVWLYNSAALTYLDVGDHATALQWIDDALELTLADGDQVGLVRQLSDMRNRAMRALGRDAGDELARRVEAFVPSPRSWTSRLDQTRGETEPSTEPCLRKLGDPRIDARERVGGVVDDDGDGELIQFGHQVRPGVHRVAAFTWRLWGCVSSMSYRTAARLRPSRITATANPDPMRIGVPWSW